MIWERVLLLLVFRGVLGWGGGLFVLWGEGGYYYFVVYSQRGSIGDNPM